MSYYIPYMNFKNLVDQVRDFDKKQQTFQDLHSAQQGVGKGTDNRVRVQSDSSVRVGNRTWARDHEVRVEGALLDAAVEQARGKLIEAIDRLEKLTSGCPRGLAELREAVGRKP